MNGGIVSIDRLPVERAALSEGSSDFDGPSRNLSRTTGFAKTPEGSCFDTVHWLVWASEILDAHGRGRSESRTNFLGGPPFLRRHQNFSTVLPLGTKSSQYQLSYGQPRTVSAPRNAARAAG